MTEQWWLDIDDPLARFEASGRRMAEAEKAVGRLADLRARALAELHVDGWSFASIAAATGMTRARAQQLVQRGRDVVP